MYVKIKKGALVSQDFSAFEWKDEEKIFFMDTNLGDRVGLVAPGYGDPDNYGNGCIYARKDDLIFEQKTSCCKSEIPEFQVFLANDKAKIPVKAHESDRCYDIYSCEDVIIPSGKWKAVCTGIHFNIPENWEIQVRPRSGLAAKNGITVLNTPGTIDADYVGEVKVILHNVSDIDFKVSIGDRIAQLAMAKSPKTKITQIFLKPEKNIRGDSGFGSTGMK